MKVHELIDKETFSWKHEMLTALFSDEEVGPICTRSISLHSPVDQLFWHFSNQGRLYS